MKSVKILCANGLEECEALNVYDLLIRAGINCELVSIDENYEIVSSHNLNFKATALLKNINFEDVDAIVLPGGLGGTNNLKASSEVRKLVLDFYNQGKLVAAICAAPSLFADLEIVKDNEYTVYPGCESEKANSTGERLHIKENIITGRALGSAFEFAAAIIKYLENEEVADKVLKQIYY